MFKVYVFAAMLKVARGLETIEFSKDMDDALDYVHFEPYIELVHKYIQAKWDQPYSIANMMKKAISGELKLTDFIMDQTPIIFEDIVISTIPFKLDVKKTTSEIIGEKYAKAVLYDDKFYDSGRAWWINYNGQPMGREVVLMTGREGLRFSVPYGEVDFNKYLYCSILFSFWLVKQAKLVDSSYRIMPSNRLCFDRPGQNGYLDKFKAMETEFPLKDGYVKSIRTKEDYDKLDPIGLKKLMNI